MEGNCYPSECLGVGCFCGLAGGNNGGNNGVQGCLTSAIPEPSDWQCVNENSNKCPAGFPDGAKCCNLKTEGENNGMGRRMKLRRNKRRKRRRIRGNLKLG